MAKETRRVRAPQPFVAMVDGVPVSFSDGQVFEVPAKLADEYLKAGLFVLAGPVAATKVTNKTTAPKATK